MGKGITIDLIAAAFEKDEDRRVRDIGQQLFAFTSKGAYGRFFNGKNNADFRNDFTVLEPDELQGRKHLRQVVLLQLIFQILREMYFGECHRKKIVIIDEAWDLLKEGEVSVFMEHVCRKFRKYGGSVVIATQSVDDLYSNPVGKAIASNSARMLLLGHKSETIQLVKEQKQLVLSPAGYNLLRSVYTEAGVYSGIFVYAEKQMGVGRLIVSDFQKLLYSTDPNDVHEIKKYQDQGLSVEEAIRSVMKDRGSLDLPENLAKVKALEEN